MSASTITDTSALPPKNALTASSSVRPSSLIRRLLTAKSAGTAGKVGSVMRQEERASASDAPTIENAG